jgi:hypothetical protein
MYLDGALFIYRGITYLVENVSRLRLFNACVNFKFIFFNLLNYYLKPLLIRLNSSDLFSSISSIKKA